VDTTSIVPPSLKKPAVATAVASGFAGAVFGLMVSFALWWFTEDRGYFYWVSIFTGIGLAVPFMRPNVLWTSANVTTTTGPEIIKCSFCGLQQDEGRQLVAGPSVFICGECIRVAMDALGTASIEAKPCCAICRTEGDIQRFLVFEGRGYLCASCVRAVHSATDHLVQRDAL